MDCVFPDDQRGERGPRARAGPTKGMGRIKGGLESECGAGGGWGGGEDRSEREILLDPLATSRESLPSYA